MKKVLYISAALSLLAVSAARAQHEGHSMPGAATATPGQQQQKPAMDSRVEGALAEVERLNRVLEAARESNDPVRLRASMDELQRSLGAISGQLRSAAPAPETGGMSGMNMSGASGASGSSGMAGMDHSKMDMKGSGTSGMDHSKMEMKGSGSGTFGKDPSKMDMKGSGSKSGASGMDHSKMDPSGSGSGKSGAGEPMDHSKMGNMPGMKAPGTKPHSASAPPAGSSNSQDSPLAKTKEPICFQEAATQGAEKATYKDKTYYFCSRADKEKFLSDPDRYGKR